MPPWAAIVLGSLSLLIATVGLVRTFVVGHKDASAKVMAEVLHKIADVQQVYAQDHERTALLEMKMGIFWRLCEEHLSGMLKKPTHLEMDNLLDKLKAHTLTLEEAQRLRWWLQRVYLEDEASHAQQRLTAILVLAAVVSLIGELERATK